MNIDVEKLKDYIQNIRNNSEQAKEGEYKKLYEYLFGTSDIEEKQKDKIKEIVEKDIQDVDHITIRAEELKDLVTNINSSNETEEDLDDYDDYYELESERQILLNKMLDICNSKKVKKLTKELLEPDMSLDEIDEIKEELDQIVEDEELEDDIEENDDNYYKYYISDLGRMSDDSNYQEQIDGINAQLELLGRIDYASQMIEDNMQDGLFSPKRKIQKKQENIYLANVMLLIDKINELPKDKQKEFYDFINQENIKELDDDLIEDDKKAIIRLNRYIQEAKDIKEAKTNNKEVTALYERMKKTSNKQPIIDSQNDKHYSIDELIEIRGKIGEIIKDLLVENKNKLSSTELEKSEKNDLLQEQQELKSDSMKILDNNIKEEEVIALAKKYKVSLQENDDVQQKQKLIDKIREEVNALTNKDNLTKEEEEKLKKYQQILKVFTELYQYIKTSILNLDNYDELDNNNIQKIIDDMLITEEIKKKIENLPQDSRDELTNDLKNELLDSLQKKPKTKIIKNRKDLLKKSLFFLGGGVLGAGLSFMIKPYTTAGLIISGTRLVYSFGKKIIKMHTKKHQGEDTRINRIISAKESFLKKHPWLNKCNNFFKDERVQLFLNGVAVGYSVGKMYQSLSANNIVSDNSSVDDNLKKFNQPSLDANETTVKNISKTSGAVEQASKTATNANNTGIIDMTTYENGFDGSLLTPCGSADAASALKGETIHLNTNYAGEGSKIVQYVDEAGKKFKSWKDVLAFDPDASSNLDDYAALVKSGAAGRYENFAYKTVDQIVKTKTR